MNIVGIGIDIIEIERIASSIDRFNTLFLNRIFTPKEQEYCQKNVSHYAGRFAAKEAVAKALGTGISGEVRWHDIEILNNNNGKPLAVLSFHIIERYGIHSTLISISHCKEYACAHALITSN